MTTPNPSDTPVTAAGYDRTAKTSDGNVARGSTTWSEASRQIWRSHPDAIEAEASPAASGDALRAEVHAFAHLMERVLRDNDYKGGWKDCSPDYLRRKLTEEYRELMEASEHGTLLRTDESSRTAEWPADVGREAADVANVAMMLADVTGNLAASPPPEGLDASALLHALREEGWHGLNPYSHQRAWEDAVRSIERALARLSDSREATDG